MKIELTLEQARDYLHEHPYGKLRALYEDPYYGRRNATICNGKYATMVLSPRSRTRGYHLQWENVLKVWRETVEDRNMTQKFIDKAKKATFTNDYIRKCLASDPSKSPYENGLSTGVPIEGKIITLKSFGKEYPELERRFREALANKVPYHSYRVRFRGYDATLDLWNHGGDTDEINGSLSLEYKDCGNGYYYMLINDDEFIGYDID